MEGRIEARPGVNPSLECRAESYEAIKPKRENKYIKILKVLEDHEMTAREVADELCRRGELDEGERQRVAPRLSELQNKLGLVETVAKKLDTKTGRTVSIYARREA